MVYLQGSGQGGCFPLWGENNSSPQRVMSKVKTNEVVFSGVK